MKFLTIVRKDTTLAPTEQRKTGAMGTVREFETLREFFNSSTLVILIDLPFVFFFIYVISLIAGPLSYVFLTAVPLVIIVGLGIQPFLAKVTRGSIESGMNKQAVLVETLNGLETVNATGSGKLMRKRYEDALNSQADGGNKIRALSMFIINFATSVQQYAQVAAIFWSIFSCRGPDYTGRFNRSGNIRRANDGATIVTGQHIIES